MRAPSAFAPMIVAPRRRRAQLRALAGTLEAPRRRASAQWPGARYLTVFLAALSISSGVISTTVFTVDVLP
jgi:hypothetical protein